MKASTQMVTRANELLCTSLSNPNPVTTFHTLECNNEGTLENSQSTGRTARIRWPKVVERQKDARRIERKETGRVSSYVHASIGLLEAVSAACTYRRNLY